MRQHLPEGLYGYNLDPEKLLCPVCLCRLIPAEIFFMDNDAEYWYVECPHCRTEYTTIQPIGRLSVPKPITHEYILSLEQRILRLENFIRNNLLTRKSVTPQREEPKRETLTNETLTKQYAFLLNT